MYGSLGIDAADVLLASGAGGQDYFPDVAVADEAGRVSFYANAGQAVWNSSPLDGLVFTYSVPMLVVGKPWDLQFADVDNDGEADVVVSFPNGGIPSIPGDDRGKLNILLNNGGFAGGSQIGIALSLDKAYGISVADLDANGFLDVAVAGMLSPGGVRKPAIEIVYDAAFGATERQVFLVEDFWSLEGTPLGTGTEVVAKKLGGIQIPGPYLDLTMSLDLDTADNAPMGVAILKYQSGSGSSTVWAKSTRVARNSWGLDVAPLRPNRIDAIVTDGEGFENSNDPDHKYNLLLATPPQQGSVWNLGPNVEIQPCDFAGAVAIGPLDNNPSNDWVISCRDSSGCDVTVVQNSGSSTAAAASIQHILTDGASFLGTGTRFVKIVDMDGDLRRDVLSSNHSCRSISVLLNATP